MVKKQNLSDIIVAMLNNSGTQVKSDFMQNTVIECLAYVDYETEEFCKALQDNGITFKLEDSYGGEGEGENYWSVYSFSKGDSKVYVKFDGYYTSYDGSNYNEWFFVEPKQVMVTQFHRIK